MAKNTGFDWGVFHDGEIVSLGASSNDLFIQIEIDYLAQRMEPPTAFFRVKASRFKGIRFELYGGETENDLARIQGIKPEILYFKIEGDTRMLECSEGILSVEYADEEIFDDQNRRIDPETIYRVAHQYWEDFGNGKIGKNPPV